MGTCTPPSTGTGATLYTGAGGGYACTALTGFEVTFCP